MAGRGIEVGIERERGGRRRGWRVSCTDIVPVKQAAVNWFSNSEFMLRSWPSSSHFIHLTIRVIV